MVVKFNWEQSGMPASLVSRMGLRSESSDFKSVLNDAQNQVMTPVDAESMARELVQSNGREYVEMVRELSTALANAKKELEEANRRYERLTADLAKRGIRYEEGASSPKKIEPSAGETATPESEPADWEDWDRRFRSLLG